MSKTVSINLTERELATTISALLFSSSVNVVSNTNEEYQNEMFELAEKFKNYKPNIKLKDVQFLKEENYEDILSEKILTQFGENFKQIVTFENLK